MPVEQAIYIDTLNPSNPTGAEKAGQGDDHLRKIKQVLQATFPGMAGAVTLTHTILNALPARIKLLEDNLLVSGVFKLTAALNANSFKIVNMADPASAQDGATKAYVDGKQGHRVGDILLTTTNVNPGLAVASGGLGYGTWTQRSQGLFLAGVGTGTDAGSVSKTLTSGANAGRYQTTLTDANLPAHAFVTDTFASADSGLTSLILAAGTAKGVAETSITGSATAVSTAPPSFAVYVWERTA